LLIACGLCGNGIGIQQTNPFEHDYECQGVPAIGSLEAAPCEAKDINIKTLHPNIVGVRGDGDHTFRGYYSCTSCIQKFEAQEYKHLRMLSNDVSSTLNPNQKVRLQKLQERSKKRSESTSNSHKRSIAALGPEAVDANDRSKSY
jgi:hypothetical protein